VLWTKRNGSTLGFSKGPKGVLGQHCSSAAVLLSKALTLCWQTLSYCKLKLPASWLAVGLEETSAVKWQLVIFLICNLGEEEWLSSVSHGFELVFD